MESSAAGPRRPWWRRYELRFNLIMAAASLVAFILGVLTDTALLAGPGLLLLIFFSVYSIYAYVRRNL